MGLAADTVAAVLHDAARRRALYGTGLLDSAPEATFDRLTRMARGLIGCEVALVTLVEHDRQFFTSALGLAEPWHSRRQTPLSHSFCQYVVASEAPLAVEDARAVPRLQYNDAIVDLGVIAYLGVPLRGPSGHVLGAVCAIEPAPRRWSEADAGWLDDLAEIARRELTLRHEANHDTLTGLANRRRFDTALAAKAGEAGAGRSTCSVVVIDLDRFKPINDRHGHGVGDEVLRRIAARLVEAVDPTDLVARIGGDEFAVLLGTPRGQPEIERLIVGLRAAVAAPMRVAGITIQVDASVGVATSGAASLADASPQRLLARADAGLYRMKLAHRTTG